MTAETTKQGEKVQRFPLDENYSFLARFYFSFFVGNTYACALHDNMNIKLGYSSSAFVCCIWKSVSSQNYAFPLVFFRKLLTNTVLLIYRSLSIFLHFLLLYLKVHTYVSYV